MWNSLPCTPADSTGATIKAFKCASRLQFLFRWSCLVHEIFRVFYVVVWAVRDGDIQNLSSFVPQKWGFSGLLLENNVFVVSPNEYSLSSSGCCAPLSLGRSASLLAFWSSSAKAACPSEQTLKNGDTVPVCSDEMFSLCCVLCQKLSQQKVV